MAEVYAVEDYIDAEKLRADLESNNPDLSFLMMQHSGLFAYYSTQAAKAQNQLDRMEHLEEIINARLDKKVRDAAAAAGTKITEAQVKAQVLLETKAIAIRTAVNKARMIASIARGAADAFRQRRDLLVQLAFNGREERKGEVRVMDERGQAGRELRHQRMEGMHR